MCKKKVDNDISNDNHIGCGIVLVLVVLAVFGASWWIITSHYAGADDFYTARGTFGDQFGAVNALFSALAFAGLIYTIILQMKELRYQREELVDNRKEMARQTNEFKQQNAALRKQTFENTFFNMLSLQQQIVSELSITDPQKVKLHADSPNGRIVSREEMHDYTYRGREVFKYLSFHVCEGYVQGMLTDLRSGGLKAFEDAYYRGLLDHYFRHFYTIVKFVDSEDGLTDEDKYQFIKILRATLSRYELVFLYYNGLSSLGSEKLKPLLEKYSVLNNLDPTLLILSYNGFQKTRAGTTEQAVRELKEAGFTGTDYELFLTDSTNDVTMYNVKAFARNQSEICQLCALSDKINRYLKKGL